MKLNRLIEITIILMNRKIVTAAELAERFGVSVRTIYRDIDVLSGSGVPVYSRQGWDGGISIMEDYTLNRTSLSESESQDIIFALQSMQATRYPAIDAILEKLSSLFKSAQSDWISIDFTPWGANPNEFNKFDMIKNAIMQSKIIEVDYINAKNQRSHRRLAPHRLIFKSQAWYIWAYCYEKTDYRTFRISRIKNAAITDEGFDRAALLKYVKTQEEPEEKPHVPVNLVLRFTEAALYRLYDDFDDDIIQNNGDGTYTVEVDFGEDNWVYGYLLSFGPNVKILSPPHIVEIIREKSREVLGLYE